MASRIEDYALIGDCQTAALVGRDGSIDWLCFPRFDSPACFAALLGRPEHGRWRIAPAVPAREVRRRYRDNTLILETEFVTDAGCVTVIDCMPERTKELQLVRQVVGTQGEVPMRLELIIRCDYGSIVPWVTHTEHGIRAIAGPDMLLVRSPVAVVGHNETTVAEFTVRAGQRLPFVMTWQASHQSSPPPLDAERTIYETERWWRRWASHCTYQGPYRDAVLRSLITLKALTFAPTGGIVAAATTSLPEELGGVRNWDYRYCWLRDASFTLYSLMMSGYIHEAGSWREWLHRAVAGKPSQINIMYGLAGERRLTEEILDWLPGYENSAPVRIGNAAHKQFQLDVFGEVLDAMHIARRMGLQLNPDSWGVGLELMKFVEEAWTQPDEGIWEVRGPRRHFTHSKVMAWVAVDRMIKSAQRFGLEGPIEHWQSLRQTMHDDICQKAFDPQRNTFTQYYGATELDASLLLIPIVGFLPAADPRVASMVAAIENELLSDGFVSRYTPKPGLDGLPGNEGKFLACTFWYADNLILQGRRAEAQQVFERLLALRNDVGLLSEEYDTRARRLIGNFPQAFSHVALVNTALNLTHEQRPAEHRPNHQ
ncbi:MAG: glycoside hydrolase family 15 protein [Gemmataceae bacterium]